MIPHMKNSLQDWRSYCLKCWHWYSSLTRKTVSLIHIIRFFGFLYNRISTLHLTIPDYKISQALSLLFTYNSWVMVLFPDFFSIVVKYPQSLVLATPGNICASFLRPVYLDLHQLLPNDIPEIPQFLLLASVLRSPEWFMFGLVGW